MLFNEHVLLQSKRSDHADGKKNIPMHRNASSSQLTVTCLTMLRGNLRSEKTFVLPNGLWQAKPLSLRGDLSNPPDCFNVNGSNLISYTTDSLS